MSTLARIPRVSGLPADTPPAPQACVAPPEPPLQDGPVLPFTFDLLAQLAIARTGAVSAAVAARHLSGVFRCVVSHGPSAPPAGATLRETDTVLDVCVRAARPYVRGELQSDPDFSAQDRSDLDIRSIAVLPILYKGRVQALLSVYSPEANYFGDRELQALQQLIRESLEPLGQETGWGMLAAQDDAEQAEVETESADVTPPQFGTIQTGGRLVSPLILFAILALLCGAAAYLAGPRGATLRHRVRLFAATGLPGNTESQPRQGVPVNRESDQATVRGLAARIVAEGTRITVALDKKVPFRSGAMASPSCVYFDLPGTELAPNAPVQMLVRGSRVVESVEVAQRPERLVRVTVKLRRHSNFSAHYRPHPPRLEAIFQ